MGNTANKLEEHHVIACSHEGVAIHFFVYQG